MSVCGERMFLLNIHCIWSTFKKKNIWSDKYNIIRLTQINVPNSSMFKGLVHLKM